MQQPPQYSPPFLLYYQAVLKEQGPVTTKKETKTPRQTAERNQHNVRKTAVCGTKIQRSPVLVGRTEQSTPSVSSRLHRYNFAFTLHPSASTPAPQSYSALHVEELSFL